MNEEVVPNHNGDYKGRFEVTNLAAQAVDLPEQTRVRVAGRVILLRPYGSLVFGHIQDSSGKIQFALHKRVLGDLFKPYSRLAGIGDFVGLEGEMWTTSTGEHTVNVSSMELLSKTLKQMPDKHQGIKNPETRQRQRNLDLLYNEDVRARFKVRTDTIREIRSYLDSHGFQEVETPILQSVACGASAKPFTTHHNKLDMDLYLRISPETYLKRLLGGSLDKVYEIGKNFRNEGMDSSHLQEFTMLEWYAAYWDYTDNMTFVEGLIKHVLKTVNGSTKLDYQGVELDFGNEWPRHDYRELLLQNSGIDLRENLDYATLKTAIQNAEIPGVDLENSKSYASLIDSLYKRTVRPTLIQPCFVVNYPTELVPLARQSDADPNVLDMFQIVVNGWEISKAYSELIDPVLQRTRLHEQQEMHNAGDEEAMGFDEDFLEAMEYGFPPMSGLGIGIDRLVALMTNAPTLKDVVLFPQLKTENDLGGPEVSLGDANNFPDSQPQELEIKVSKNAGSQSFIAAPPASRGALLKSTNPFRKKERKGNSGYGEVGL